MCNNNDLVNYQKYEKIWKYQKKWSWEVDILGGNMGEIGRGVNMKIFNCIDVWSFMNKGESCSQFKMFLTFEFKIGF